jgi:hypothetical protein
MMTPGSANPLLAGDTSTYNINNSLRFRSSASAYLSRTPASAGNQQKWTWSGWVKRGQLSSSGYLEFFSTGTASNNYASIQFGLDSLQVYNNTAGTATLNLNTTAVYRDPSAWYHIVVAIDTTQATAANRALLYVNGVQVTSFSTATYPSQNANLLFNASGQVHAIGAGYNGSYRDYFDGYLTEVNFIDGQALTPSSFGAYSTNGVWQPARYTGTYGTNGFYLKFASFGTAAALGTDSSGNGNTWTVNNLSITAGTTYDPMLDSPTLTSATVANYAVLNPLVKRWSVASETFSNGNLTVTNAGASNDYALGTTFVSSGQYYWEVTATTVSGSFAIGVDNGQLQNSVSTNTVFYNNDGTKSVAGTGTSYGSTYTSADVIGVALDKNANTVTFYKNNTSQGSISLPVTTVPMGAAISPGSSGGIANINFGQRAFSYTPPSGFVALNAYNLPTPTIANGATVMAATTYTGNGTSLNVLNSNNTTTAVSFQPDFVWIKDRTAARSNWVLDVLRGVYNILSTNATSAESTVSTTLTAFNSNGFSVGSNADFNTNTEAYIGWQWKAGGAGVTNTNGSITSTVSVNATAGFSVVTYTGTGANATVGHGLGVAPVMIIIKSRVAITGSADWIVGNQYCYSTTAWVDNYALTLNLSNGKFGTEFLFGNPSGTAPTSTVFSVGTSTQTNKSATTYVAYCWSAVAGYSAFGSYTGNGSADGPFVYLGFRPRYILWKRTDTTADWGVIDTSRDPYNTTGYDLTPNAAAAEGSGYTVDFLSNGFKIRLTATRINASGGTYVYAAFAENPFKYALAR